MHILVRDKTTGGTKLSSDLQRLFSMELCRLMWVRGSYWYDEIGARILFTQWLYEVKESVHKYSSIHIDSELLFGILLSL